MFGLKRQIEEKTEDWHARVDEERERRNAEYAERVKNRADAEAAAKAADPARIKKLRAGDRKRHAAWSFSCKVSAGFIVVRWTAEGKAHSHALAMKSVTDIQMRAGQPVRPTGTCVAVYGNRWDYAPDREWWGRGSPGWGERLDTTFSSPAESAVITFVGVGFAIERIPHRKADEAYQAIMSAIEEAT